MNKLTYEEVSHIAELAKLRLTEEEKDIFREQLSEILTYAQMLQEVDTNEISPTATVLPLRNVLRDDETCPSMSREETLANAPATEDGRFKVKLVLD